MVAVLVLISEEQAVKWLWTTTVLMFQIRPLNTSCFCFVLFCFFFHSLIYNNVLNFFPDVLRLANVNIISVKIANLWFSGIAGGGGGGQLLPGRNAAPLAPQMKLHFVQRSMESHHFESQSAPLLTPEPPLLPPHFGKSGFAPALDLFKVAQMVVKITT